MTVGASHRAKQHVPRNLRKKSSAGDKFETHRAMMHLQIESFIKRLQVAQELHAQLRQVPLVVTQTITLGSLVMTEQGAFFISISAPSCVIEGQEYLCMSPEAPMYRAMRGLQAEDWMEWKSPQSQEDDIEIIGVY